MIIVKLIVLFVYVKYYSAIPFDYCEICLNHTLCKYTTPGPSPICKAYDKSALLTNNDIIDIVNRINDRRNFVAMGRSKKLPQAANMKKIVWSEELASFAQRWVDQCDDSLQPDKEDQCRDLATVKVGQSIASISGPAPGLHVKSFVEIWFMQTLDYTGSISYYNMSRDYKTNHFTQLIWADTELVGCGKAKFYTFSKNKMIERVVCNFASKGNIHGKPVYLIGLPATQCPQKMISDDKFPGLCNYQSNGNVRKFTSQRPLVSSLLRILNLSNDPVKQEIDPIRNNLKLINFNSNKTNVQRNQKTRHVFLDNSHGAMKRVPPTQGPNLWNNPANNSRKFENKFQNERGHSRVYHGHDLRNNLVSTQHENTEQNFRRYDYTTDYTLNSYSKKDFRKNYPSEQCTRKAHAPERDFCSPSECKNVQCTRGQSKECCQQTVKCCPPISQTPVPCLNPTSRHICPHDLCPCNNPTIPCSTPLPCNHNTKCDHISTSCSHTNCRKALRNQYNFMKDETKKPTEFQYYDIFPNIGMRSGDKKLLHDDSLISDDSKTEKSKKLHNNGHISPDRNHKQVKDVIDYPKSYDQDRDYLYGSFASSKKKKRNVEDQINTLKPFWQMDEFSHIKPTQLKALRYTTLPNKRNKKTKRTTVTSTKRSISMESITITSKESLFTSNNQRDHKTEKYLSFEELMHLRKLTTTKELDYDARRQASGQVSTTETTPSTSEVTTNTAFVRKKHCTRKLTCTWTGSTVTGQDGNVIVPGGGDRGSRTPPGYVDGCSRTSTCTREFMNRNRISTASDSSSQPTPEDEDYCERRSLNVHRRNSDEQVVTDLDIGYQEAYVNTPQSTSYDFYKTVTNWDRNQTTKGHITAAESKNDCFCRNNNARIKRDKSNNRKVDDDIETKHLNSPVSYVELYYLVLRNIMNAWENNRYSYQPKKCLCNCSWEKQNFLVLKLFLLLLIILLH